MAPTRFRLLRASCALLTAAGCGIAVSDPVQPPPPAPQTPGDHVALPRDLTAPERSVIAASNDFGLRLLRELNVEQADSNIFLSPLSASIALSMALDGAASTTYTEMRDVLGLGALTSDEINNGCQSLISLLDGLDSLVDFRIANAAYFDDKFVSSVLPSYQADATTHFGARVATIDFGAPWAVDTINHWVDGATNGKIDTLFVKLDGDFWFLLLNAIYFKGAWRYQFDPDSTMDLPFTSIDGTFSNVPTMNRWGGFLAGYTPDAFVIELPYGGDAFAMTILLPRKGVPVNDLVNELTAQDVVDLAASLHDVSGELGLYLPKFRLEWEKRLETQLQQMGMTAAFEPGRADFSRMSPDPLVITLVKQKSWVDVNEEGTEAAVVTAVGGGPTSSPAPVHVDRPFLFMIRERLTGTILFLGKVVRLPAE